MILRPNSRSCRTASIRSGIAGGLAGELGTVTWSDNLDLAPDAMHREIKEHGRWIVQ